MLAIILVQKQYCVPKSSLSSFLYLEECKGLCPAKAFTLKETVESKLKETVFYFPEEEMF